jgi:hypothetical protein
VTDVHALLEIIKESGICLLNTLKQALAIEAQQITDQRVKCLTRLRAFDYYDVAVNLAGVLFLGQEKTGSQHNNKKKRNRPADLSIRQLGHI